MTDSWTALLSRPAFLLPHPDPYPFTKQLSKSQSHSSLRSKLKFASRHQSPSSRLLASQLVRRATTTSKPSTLCDRAPKLDPLYFPVIDLTVPSCEEDMNGPGTRRALSSSSPKAKCGLAQANAKTGCNADYKESDDEKNDNDNGTEGRTECSSHVGSWRSSRFRPRTALDVPGDQLQPPSLQHAQPRLVHDMTEEFTSPYSLSGSSPANSSSNSSIILHARATLRPPNTPALAFPMVDLEMNTDTNAKIAGTKVEQKGKEFGMVIDGRSTPSAPPLTWAKVAFDTPFVPGESPSTSTSSTSASPSTLASISLSASTACRKSPAPEVVVTTDINIADKDTMAEAAMTTARVSRSKSLMRSKSKRRGSGKAQRRLDDGGECKSDTVEDAQSAFASTSAPPSTSVLRKHQTYKHKRTASLGDAAVLLFLGAEQRKEGRNDDDDDELEDFEFSEKWIEANSNQALQSNQHTSPIKRARFVILGSESDVDLPCYHRSSPVFSLSPTSSPLGSKVSSAAHLPEVSAASTSASRRQTQQPPSSFPASTSVQRPALVRRDALVDSREPVRPRRWTLASAMTDEAISDEGLVRELERMHQLGVWNRELLSKGGERSSEGDNTILVDADSTWDVGREIWEGMLDREKEKGKADEDGEVVHRNPSSSLLGTASWLTAQRALLICRELIMTERHYHALLLSLLAGDTHTPPPSLMQPYAAELVRASAAVLKAMEQQPSALGVAKAFVENAEEVEGAYVRWCGVVGGWFVAGGVEETGSLKLKRNWSRYRSSIDSAIPPAATDTSGRGGVESEGGDAASSPPVGPLKRTVRTWRRSLPSVASLGEAGASIYGYGYVYGSLRRRNKDKVAEEEQNDGVGRDLSSTTPSSSSSSGQNLTSRPPRLRSKPAVRDLAILPTQRVMRYVLLYRDLLSHTPPTSSSRVFVEQAVDAACRIADKCDRAQGNAAFIVADGGAGAGAAGGGSSPAATQSAAEAETTSRRSNSGRTTATTSSVDSTPPSSVEGERQREEAEEEEGGQGKFESGDGCHVKLSSSMRRMSMNVSFMSSIGWGRS